MKINKRVDTMWSIKILIKKTIQTIRESGFKIFLKKAVHYIYKSSKKEDNTESPEKINSSPDTSLT